MYQHQHHQDSIENLVNHYKVDKEVIAVILGGSVAKGLARPDSDVDAMIVVTEQRYAELVSKNRISECTTEGITYENGYYDIKYCTEEYLQSVMKKGSEPARNAYKLSRCLYTKNEYIKEWIQQIPVFQKQEKPQKLASFYSAFSLNEGYFWWASGDDIYLKVRAAADMVLFGYRLLLQEAEVLFPCNKSLVHTVRKLPDAQKPEGIVEKAELLLHTLTEEAKQDFVTSIVEFIQYKQPEDYAEVLTCYIDDNELWWYKDRPVIAEW